MDDTRATTSSHGAGQQEVQGITEAVIRTIAQLLNQEVEFISPSTRLFEDLALDSTGVLELLMQLETDLGAEFDPETLEPDDFETVESLVTYVVKNIEP